MGNQDFDNILVQLGMGNWNMLYIVTAAYSCLLTPPQYLSGVYLAPGVHYECLVPETERDSSVSEDSCHYFRNTSEATKEKVTCDKWVFNDEVFTSTMTSEFELVCERGHLRASYQGAYLFGTLLGQYTGGYLADRYGRKIVIVITHVVLSVSAIGMIFLNNFTAILVFRFINGAVYMLLPYVLAMEVCPPKHRSTVGILTGLPWAMSTIMWGIVAYFIREWRYLQLAVSLPSILIFIPLYLIDESPRWLIVKGRHEEALKVLKHAARLNKSSLPPEEQLLKLMKHIEGQTVESKKKKDSKKNKTIFQKIKELTKPKLLSTKKIAVITIALCFNFFTVSLVFDGLNLSGEIYSADPFLYIILGGLVEVPGYSLTAPLVARFGRRTPTIINYIFCGVVILLVAFIPSDINWLVMTLALAGKFFISAAYQIIYVYSTELFPTEVRSEGIGLSCLSQQIAGACSPYITAFIGPLVPWVPSVLFGGASLLSGFVTLSLKETLNVPLPDTVADLERDNEEVRDRPKALPEELNALST